MADTTGSGRGRRTAAGGRTSIAKWGPEFLAELAATSNVAAAARKAGVTSTKAYEARRTDPEFYRQWHMALFEGYELLEMALVRRLREGELRPAAGSRHPMRVYDNANALRLLAAHKETVSRQRAIRDHRDTEVILASISAKLERIRERRLAIATEAASEPHHGPADGE